MTAETVWTIKRLLDWTVEYFAKNDSIQPRLDAEILLAEALGCQRIELYTRFDEEVAAEPRGKFRDWVKRRAEGVPVAYLVGHREFFSLEFDVNEHVLIPRPETEHLVTTVLDLIAEHFAEQPVRIVDVGTGSGCIAISIAKHCDKAAVDAVDISDKALELARTNADKHGVSERVRFVLSDLLQEVERPESVNIVVSNPPYVGTKEANDLPIDVRDHEPHVALFANDQDGVVLSENLMRQMVELQCGQFLVLESSPMIIERLAEFAQANGFADVTIRKDFGGLQRWIVARRQS